MVEHTTGLTDMVQEVNRLREEAKAYPGEGFDSRAEQILTEFRYMADFMMRGYKDEKREELYRGMEQRAVNLRYDMQVRQLMRGNVYMKAVKYDQALNAEEVQTRLMDTITDPKMHHEVLTAAFNNVMTGYHWTESEERLWTALLVSDMVGRSDRCALVGALTLSAITVYNEAKVRCLVNVWRFAADKEVAGRAFVGAVIALNQVDDHSTRVSQEVYDGLLGDTGACDRLIALTTQLMLSSKAEADNGKLQKEVMPSIMKSGRGIRLGPNGLIEQEEENISQEEEERRFAEMEKAMKKMTGMQKQGSDVFFGGFKAMKRFPFFYKTANWFMPFTAQHPDITDSMKRIGESALVDRVTGCGPFCSSDKYSFVIAVAGLIESLPQGVRDMLNGGEVSPLVEGARKVGLDDDMLSQLHYVQDLYRFFRLNSLGMSLGKPFDISNIVRTLAVSERYMTDTQCVAATDCLVRAGDMGQTEWLEPYIGRLENAKESMLEACHVLARVYDKVLSDRQKMAEQLSKALLIKDDDLTAMKRLSAWMVETKQYEEAAGLYDRLRTQRPETVSHQLNYIMTMDNAGRAEEVLNLAYKLTFEHEHNALYQNVLGWTLLCAGKGEKAMDVYEKMAGEEHMTADYNFALNAMYAYVAGGEPRKGVDVMTAYANKNGANDIAGKVNETMTEDARMLEQLGIGRAERAVVVGLLGGFLL